MAPPPDSGVARADEGFWVAVLPFKHGGSNGDLAALADGLTDDTITGLSKFSYLRVIARSSSSRYVGQSVDVRTAGIDPSEDDVTHQGAVGHDHLDDYLDEFVFRFNCRTSASRGNLFYRLAQQAVQVDPVPFAILIKPRPVGPGGVK